MAKIDGAQRIGRGIVIYADDQRGQRYQQERNQQNTLRAEIAIIFTAGILPSDLGHIGGCDRLNFFIRHCLLGLSGHFNGGAEDISHPRDSIDRIHQTE